MSLRKVKDDELKFSFEILDKWRNDKHVETLFIYISERAKLEPAELTKAFFEIVENKVKQWSIVKVEGLGKKLIINDEKGCVFPTIHLMGQLGCNYESMIARLPEFWPAIENAEKTTSGPDEEGSTRPTLKHQKFISQYLYDSIAQDLWFPHLRHLMCIVQLHILFSFYSPQSQTIFNDDKNPFKYARDRLNKNPIKTEPSPIEAEGLEKQILQTGVTLKLNESFSERVPYLILRTQIKGFINKQSGGTKNDFGSAVKQVSSINQPQNDSEKVTLNGLSFLANSEFCHHIQFIFSIFFYRISSAVPNLINENTARLAPYFEIWINKSRLDLERDHLGKILNDMPKGRKSYYGNFFGDYIADNKLEKACFFDGKEKQFNVFEKSVINELRTACFKQAKSQFIFYDRARDHKVSELVRQLLHSNAFYKG